LGGTLEGVLRGNDVAGHHTVPAAALYPHQWNWDSPLTALGWATFDRDRAWCELESLLAAQDPGDGLVAHIAFDEAATSYNPGPEWWSGRRGADGRCISDITQPPLAATVIRILISAGDDAERARPLLEPLQRWHEFLIDLRGGGGEPVLIHPWESGRDNGVEWDAPLQAVTPSTRVPVRRDHAFVEAVQRPPARDYARYYGLIETYAHSGWDARRMAAESPFRVLDPAFSALSAAAAADLAAVAQQLGADGIAARASVHAASVESALRARANVDGMASAHDLVAGTDAIGITAALPLQLLRPELPVAAVDRLQQLILGGELASEYGVRSAATSAPGFDPRNYWRGPVWSNVTWLCALGLERHGRGAAAAELRSRVIRHAAVPGCREYVHPDTGEGLGASGLSWTAALALDAMARLAGVGD